MILYLGAKTIRLVIITSLIGFAPWLPPKIRTVGLASFKLKYWRARLLSPVIRLLRTGFPVKMTLELLKNLPAVWNDIKTFLAILDVITLAKPGTESDS